MASAADPPEGDDDGRPGDLAGRTLTGAARGPRVHPDSASHRPSHRGILRDLGSYPAPMEGGEGLGAVLVPAYRSIVGEPPGLRLAARLASRHDCVLLVPCSGAARSQDVPAAMRRELGTNLIAWDLPSGAGSLPDLKSARHPLCTLWRSNDAAVKRNLGLAAAVAAGWAYLLFVDDDVSAHDHGPTLDEKGLEDALGAMRADPLLSAVGWPLQDFPDNSVVGHARRLAGQPQHVFLSSGALLVRCGPGVPFFPGVYNEDWFFMVAAAQAAPRYRDCFAWAGRARQLPYEPYSVARAMSEEPGDILGEGLMNLLEDDGPALWTTATTISYWRKAAGRRAALISEILRSLDREVSPSVTADRRLRARRALRAALRVHKQARPELLRNYVNDWRADLQVWHRYLSSLAAAGAVRPRCWEDVLAKLAEAAPVSRARP